MRERVERLGDVKLLYEEGSEEGGFGWIFWLVNYVKFFVFQNLEDTCPHMTGQWEMDKTQVVSVR